MIELKEVDISKIRGCSHPDIKANTYYLAKINRRWFAGTFTHQWYGWNFDAVYDAGYHLSYGKWEALYEIVDTEVKPYPVIFDILHQASEEVKG